VRTFGSITTARIANAITIDNTWKESTSVPALNASLAKKICSAQKAENSRTLKSGEVVSVLIAFLSSAQIYPGMQFNK